MADDEEVDWPSLPTATSDKTKKPIVNRVPKMKQLLSYLGSDIKGGEDASTINHMDTDDWTRTGAVMNLGAAESIAPPSFEKPWPVRERDVCRLGQQHHTSDGNRIPYTGERVVPVAA